MTDREIKIELAKAALMSESPSLQQVKAFFDWVVNDEVVDLDIPKADYNDKPIGEVISQIIKSSRYNHSYAVRLEKVFSKNEIKTVGDLLRYGRTDFSRILNVGRGSLARIDDALEELYGLKSWC